MKKRNMASFLVDREFLDDALQLPAGHQVFAAEWDSRLRTVRFFVAGPDMPAVKPGEMPPSINPSIDVYEDRVTGLHKFKWRWGL